MNESAIHSAVIALPWLSKDLSPNARLHFMAKARAVKSARKASAELAWAALGFRRPMWAGAKLDVTFCPPDKRRRDLDNCIASFKAGSDGISDALGIDDSRFETTYAMGAPVKGGVVNVTVRAA